LRGALKVAYGIMSTIAFENRLQSPCCTEPYLLHPDMPGDRVRDPAINYQDGNPRSVKLCLLGDFLMVASRLPAPHANSTGAQCLEIGCFAFRGYPPFLPDLQRQFPRQNVNRQWGLISSQVCFNGALRDLRTYLCEGDRNE
jgi:hypothetical protein